MSWMIMIAAQIINILLSLLWWLILVSALLSWFAPELSHPTARSLRNVAEPFLKPIRKLIPMYGVSVDISPVVALLIIHCIRGFVVRTLIQIAIRLR